MFCPDTLALRSPKRSTMFCTRSSLRCFRRMFKVCSAEEASRTQKTADRNGLEFIPYVFQLFAAILETNPSGALTERHQSLIPPILMPALWESKGNVPALVRLLSAVIARGPSYLVANSHVEPVLGIFQKLISTKANESYAFDVIEAVVTHIPV